ncbi:methyl-accepting chemotaxis protein [Cohnella sp.]|uniref:methyl-accepting chemotaxis protein n=1 Tax=Cohnella sp. TaxID=1883426 RepID=UPI0035659C12
MRKLKFSLTVQLILFITLIFILPVATIGTYFYTSMLNNLTQVEKEHVENANLAASKLLDDMGNSLLNVTKTNSHWEDNRAAAESNDVEWLKENVDVAVDIVPNLHFLATVSPDGSILSQKGDVKEFTGKLAYPEILKRLEQESDFSGLVLTSKGLASIAVSKITNEAGDAPSSGVLVFGRLLDVQAIKAIKLILQQQADVAVLARNAPLMSTSETILETQLQARSVAAMADGGYLESEVSKRNKWRYSHAFASLKGIDGKPLGVLYVTMPSEASTNVANSIFTLSLTVGLILLMLLALLSMLIHKRILVPMHGVADTLNKVSEGKLTGQVEEKYGRRKDEIGEISSSVNVMIRTLRQLISHIGDTAALVSASSEQLSASSGETSEASHVIADAINGVAQGAERQAIGSEESVVAVSEMTSGVRSIEQTSLAVTEASQHAASEAEQGNELVQRAIRQMNQISVTVNRSADVVQRLGERSEEIGKIIEMISQVAAQTNLLALNAAIEAARAGEEGRGFAVVAGEVRKLAVQSEDSARQISVLVKEVLSYTHQAVDAMNEGTEEVQAGLAAVNDSGEAFRNILTSVMSVTGQIQGVTMVVHQLSELSEQVAGMVRENAAIARESAAATQNVVATTEEQLAAMQEIAASAASLNHAAEELTMATEKFTI